MPSILKQLSNLIAASVDQIDAACEAQGLQFPSLDEPFSPESEGARHIPDVLKAIDIIVVAANQLIATAQPPISSAIDFSNRLFTAAVLHAVNEANIAEIVREGGPKGLHVSEIANKSGLDADRIGRLLRLLATNYVFKEVSPDVFSHNRISALLDTGKSLETLKKDPIGKHDGTTGFSAIIGGTLDQGLACGGVLLETLQDPKFGHSQEPNEAVSNKAYNTTLQAFEFLELPGNEARFRRLGVAMDGSSRMHPPDTLLKGFSFATLPENGLVVDVAGGLGSVSLVIAKAYPKLNIIVEDRPQVMIEAEKFWMSNLPKALNTNRVRLVGIDMFAAQPEVSNKPDLFILRQILHDWSDLYAHKILKHLRDAAGLNTRLLIAESVLSYACEQSSDEVAIKGAKLPALPAPLLPNVGGANALTCFKDIAMMMLQNGQERTLLQYANLLKSAGWELKEVRRPVGSGHGHLTAVPI
ncbi:O-methyltransferase [Dentipellis sp. KUC8613]|nr:O-methyltransferase [Dentipellis sp. KUC8613]